MRTKSAYEKENWVLLQYILKYTHFKQYYINSIEFYYFSFKNILK